MNLVSLLKTGRFAALLTLQLIWLSIDTDAQSNRSLRSPDARIEVQVRAVNSLSYSVSLGGKPLLFDCTLSMKIDQRTLGSQPKIRSTQHRYLDQTVQPAVRQKFASIRENYNELRLEMEGNYAVVFRAYNEGVAYHRDLVASTASKDHWRGREFQLCR